MKSFRNQNASQTYLVSCKINLGKIKRRCKNYKTHFLSSFLSGQKQSATRFQFSSAHSSRSHTPFQLLSHEGFVSLYLSREEIRVGKRSDLKICDNAECTLLLFHLALKVAATWPESDAEKRPRLEVALGGLALKSEKTKIRPSYTSNLPTLDLIWRANNNNNNNNSFNKNLTATKI